MIGIGSLGVRQWLVTHAHGKILDKYSPSFPPVDGRDHTLLPQIDKEKLTVVEGQFSFEDSYVVADFVWWMFLVLCFFIFC